MILFDCERPEDLDQLLRGLSKVATFQEGTAFYFFSELPGEAEFECDCELISGAIITSRKGHYFCFFGHLIDALTRRFGTLEIGEENSLPA